MSNPSCTTASSSATVVSSISMKIPAWPMLRAAGEVDLTRGVGRNPVASGGFVDAAGEVRVDSRPYELVEREAVTTRSLEGATRAMRDLEGADRFPAAALQLGERRIEVVDPVHQHGPLAMEVPGQEDIGPVS